MQPRLDQYAVDYRNQLDEAAMQVFRGSNNPRSVLQDHSLLEDMYGNDSLSNGTPPGVSVISAVGTVPTARHPSFR